MSAEHSAGGGCDVCKGSALNQLNDHLLLQDKEDVKLHCHFFPVILLTELPEAEGIHSRFVQVLQERKKRSSWVMEKQSSVSLD